MIVTFTILFVILTVSYSQLELSGTNNCHGKEPGYQFFYYDIVYNHEEL